MTMRGSLWFLCLLATSVTGCGGGQTSPAGEAKDWPDLQARFDKLRPGMAEPEVAAALGGKGGGPLVGYSMETVSRKPEAEAVPAGQDAKFWMSADLKGEIEVNYRDDGRGGRTVESIKLYRVGQPGGPSVRPGNQDGK